MKNTSTSKYRINDLVLTSYSGYYLVKDIRYVEKDGFLYLLKKVYTSQGTPVKNSTKENWFYENWIHSAEEHVNKALDNYREIYRMHLQVLEDEGFFNHE